ncbi:MAG: ATP-dependent metallopeptidase FtsH/Yme1/Tma family protein, partial [Eubacterium sp.]
MKNNLSKNWKSAVFYILIPLVLIGSVFLFSNQSKEEVKNYSEIVDMFRTDQVTEFSLDLSSGKLQYKLKTDKDKNKINTYNVPSVTYFIEDIGPYVNEYNTKNPDNQIVYNYVKGSGGSWWVSLLPSLILVIVIIASSVWMIKRMGNTLGGETNRTLSFGKIKAKSLDGDDENKKTFKDVAGCD